MSKILNTSKVTSKYTLPDQSKQDSTVESNESSTEYMTTSLQKIRSSAKEFGAPGEEVEQTLTLQNDSPYEISNITVKDVIGEGATAKAGSVKIDGEEKTDFDPVTGFILPKSLQANGKTVITYTLVVNNKPTVSSINLQSDITYDVVEVEGLNEKSNVLELTISYNQIVIEKTSNVTAVISGQTLTFQNVIRNLGNIKNTEVMFIDDIPQGTQFVANSVTIDGEKKEGLNPANGISLNDLDPNVVITVTFEVSVD